MEQGPCLGAIRVARAHRLRRLVEDVQNDERHETGDKRQQQVAQSRGDAGGGREPDACGGRQTSNLTIFLGFENRASADEPDADRDALNHGGHLRGHSLELGNQHEQRRPDRDQDVRAQAGRLAQTLAVDAREAAGDECGEEPDDDARGFLAGQKAGAEFGKQQVHASILAVLAARAVRYLGNVRPRWLVARILAALLAVSVAAGCGNSVGPSHFSQGIVAFGDSLVVGFGAGSGNDFVSLLESRLSVNIVNAGRLGDTTATGLARLDEDVLNREREIVIVLLGGNDLLRGVPVQERIDNITKIVQRIRGTGADVILVGLGEGPLDAFAGALPGLASQTSSTLVPGILEGIFGQPGLMFDAIHPNSAGHKIMADRIEPALRALVNQSQSAVSR